MLAARTARGRHTDSRMAWGWGGVGCARLGNRRDGVGAGVGSGGAQAPRRVGPGGTTNVARGRLPRLGRGIPGSEAKHARSMNIFPGFKAAGRKRKPPCGGCSVQQPPQQPPARRVCQSLQAFHSDPSKPHPTLTNPHAHTHTYTHTLSLTQTHTNTHKQLQVPVGDNYFAALNSAVFSDGSFVFVPKVGFQGGGIARREWGKGVGWDGGVAWRGLT